MTRLSVIICTHNPKADQLQRVLDALAAQTLPRSHWDLLLIDNASHIDLAAHCDLSWHPSSRSVREDTLGLTPARVRGIRECRSEVLVYVDDDNVLDANYLQTVLDLMDSHPSLGAIGAGALEPEFAVKPSPELVPHVALLALRCLSQAAWSRNPTDTACVPWGAGLCVTRQVALACVQLVEQLDAHGLLDRRGQRLYGNGDVAFSWAASLIGKGFGVFPELRVTHLIAAERLTQRYFLQMVFDSTFSNTVSDYLFLGVHPTSSARRWLEMLRLPVRAIRRGAFAVRISWAGIRGADQARELIKLKRLQPLVLERSW
jgi:glycosyltransferase involved in cell wall biosynthesis